MTDAPARSPLRRSLVITIVKLTVSLALLALLLSRVDTLRLWARARHASLPWLGAALVVYVLNVIASTWRWHVLLRAQDVRMPSRTLLQSFLVANFFNNFLPSNIGGDVIRIRDTARAARSKTLAATVILLDRALGLMGLAFIAAIGASMAVGLHKDVPPPVWPVWLWAVFVLATAVLVPVVWAPQRLRQFLAPLTRVHPEWVGERLQTLTEVLTRFKERPASVAGCFGGALVVQALVVLFYLAIVRALDLPIEPWDLAVIVPLSLILQMLPVSVNGFGVREAAFSLYFARIHQSMESGVLLSLFAAALIMLFSLSGAAVYVSRRQ